MVPEAGEPACGHGAAGRNRSRARYPCRRWRRSRARVGGGRRRDLRRQTYVCDGARECASADPLDVEADLRSALHPADLSFRNLGQEPHAPQVADREEIGACTEAAMVWPTST